MSVESISYSAWIHLETDVQGSPGTERRMPNAERQTRNVKEQRTDENSILVVLLSGYFAADAIRRYRREQQA